MYLTDLRYHRARYVDELLGSWTQEDPIGFTAGDPSLHRYVGNQPTGFTDPSGLQMRHGEMALDRIDRKSQETQTRYVGDPEVPDPTGPFTAVEQLPEESFDILSVTGFLGEACSYAPVAGELAEGGQVLLGFDISLNRPRRRV